MTAIQLAHIFAAGILAFIALQCADAAKYSKHGWQVLLGAVGVVGLAWIVALY